MGAICAQLDREPLLHASLGSRELFHSNFLAWYIDRHPGSARRVFEPWTRPAPGVPAAPTERERYQLDLVVHLADAAPLVIENKVFSPPREAQLERYAADAAVKYEPAPEFVLLSLSDPGWSDRRRTLGGHMWWYQSYGGLGATISDAARVIDDGYDRSIVEHYGQMVEMLQQAADLVAVAIDDNTPFAMPDDLARLLHPIRLDQGFQKLRTRSIAHHVQDHLSGQGLEVTVVDAYLRTHPILEAFNRAPGTDEEIGWQYQERQWRLASRVLPTHPLYGRGETLRHKRAQHLAQRYADWFDFTLVDQVLGTTEADSPKPDVFRRFEPDFIYQYRRAPAVTVAQLCELATLLARRALTMRTP